jgi:hypothetical protein
MGDQAARRSNPGRSSPQRPSQDDLPHLLAEVRRTRTAQHETLMNVGANSALMLPVQHDSLEALEAYARAVHVHGWPVPPKMRAEIQLLRSLCGVIDLFRL